MKRLADFLRDLADWLDPDGAMVTLDQSDEYGRVWYERHDLQETA